MQRVPGQLLAKLQVLSLVALVWSILTTQCASAWRSSLYPVEWSPGYTDEQGRFLHDFSYAGYHGGEKPVPIRVPGPWVDVTQAPYYADPTGKAVAVEAIQQAIDDVGRHGGGTVYLPPGTYRLKFPAGSNAALRINWSRVLLSGAGSDKTFLYLDETTSRSKLMLEVRPPSHAWYVANPSRQQMLRADILIPTVEIQVNGTPLFTPGDWVALTHNVTAEWIKEHNMTGLWKPGAIEGQLIFRRIIAVDQQKGTITIDIPTRYPLKVRDSARLYKVDPPLDEVGVTGFSFGMKENPNKTGWGEDDHSTYGNGAYDVHASVGIQFRGVENGWLTDIRTYKPQDNVYAHIHSIGVFIKNSRHVTVRQVAIENPQYRGGGGNGYCFAIDTQDTLLHRITAINGRHNITFTRGATNGNVVLGGYIKGPDGLPADFHAFLSPANLIDNLTIDQDRFEAIDRISAKSVGGISHGMTTSQSVFWNIEGLAYKPDNRGESIIASDQFGWGYVIGTRGPAAHVQITKGLRTKPADLLEGEGEGTSLEPQSLYIDQLWRRLQREGKAAAWEAVAGDLQW